MAAGLFGRLLLLNSNTNGIAVAMSSKSASILAVQKSRRKSDVDSVMSPIGEPDVFSYLAIRGNWLSDSALKPVREKTPVCVVALTAISR